MRQNQENQPQWLKVMGVCLAVIVVGGVYGLIMVIIVGVTYFLYQNKAKQTGTSDSPVQSRGEAAMEEFPHSVGTEDREMALAHAKSSFDTPREHRDRHMQELKDLLNAGIIEQDEYNDRVKALRH